jgi:hypothetical protein
VVSSPVEVVEGALWVDTGGCIGVASSVAWSSSFNSEMVADCGRGVVGVVASSMIWSFDAEALFTGRKAVMVIEVGYEPRRGLEIEIGLREKWQKWTSIRGGGGGIRRKFTRPAYGAHWTNGQSATIEIHRCAYDEEPVVIQAPDG